MIKPLPIISIIIPVYNVERYIKECVDSILQIKLESVEILLIDDGSTDSSGKICDWFGTEYENIFVFHQTNQGLSAARNRGIIEAKGDFLLFIDSDDFIEANTILNILERIQLNPDLDVIFLRAKKIYPSGRQELLDEHLNRNKIVNHTRDEVISYLAGLKKYPGSACTKAVNRKLVLLHNIWFETGKTAEDLLWCLKIFLNANFFDVINTEYYYYRQEREGSITQQYDEKKLICILEVIENSYILAKDNLTVKNAIYSFMAYEYVIALLIYGYGKKGILKEKQKSYKKIFRQYRFLLLYRKDIRIKVIWFLTGLLGIDAVSKLVGMYYRIK